MNQWTNTSTSMKTEYILLTMLLSYLLFFRIDFQKFPHWCRWELRKHLGIRGMNIEGRKAALASRVLAVARVENQNQNHEGEEEEVVEEEEGSTEHRPEWTEVEGEDWVDTNEEDYQDSVDEVDYSDEEDEEWEEGTEWVWK